MQIFWRVVRLQGFLARNAGRYSQAPTKAVANIGIRQWLVRVGRLPFAQRLEHNFDRYFTCPLKQQVFSLPPHPGKDTTISKLSRAALTPANELPPSDRILVS
jgi:hypothetical protein